MGIENKAIQIEEAKQGERVIENKTVGTSQEFIDQLTLAQVDDLFASNVKIKNDREKYIISVNDRNIFAVNGTTTLQDFLQAFYDNKAKTDKREESKKALIKITGLRIEYITGKTKGELDLLKKEMQNQKNAYEASHDIGNIKAKLDKNINFYEVEIKAAKDKSRFFYAPKAEYTREDKALFKLEVAQLQERLDRLQKMKEETLKIEAGKYDNTDVNQWEGDKTLIRFNDEITEIARDADDFILQRNDIIEHKGNTTTYHSINVASLVDAEKAKNALAKYNDDYKKINTVLLNADEKQELAEDLTALNVYLNKVLSNPNTFDPSKNPFVPKHLDAFNELLRADPTLRRFLGEGGIPTSKVVEDQKKNDNTKDKINNGEGTDAKTDTKTYAKQTNTDQKAEDKPDYGGMGLWDTFKKGGIKGSVRKLFDIFPQMADSTKNTWTSLLIAGGVGFGVFKLGKWLFSGKWNKEQKDKTPFRQRMLIVGGVTLGFNAFGSNPFKFAGQLVGGGLDPSALKMDFSKLGLFGGSKAANEQAQENGEVDVRSVVEIFGKTPIEKLSTYIDPKTMELTSGGYNGLLAYFNVLEEEATTDSDKNSFKNKKDLIQKIRNNKDKNILKNSFALLGITPDNLTTLSGTVNDQAKKNISLDGGKESRDEKDNANIADQVKSFSGLTEAQKTSLVKYGNIFYDQKPSGPEQKVEFKEDGGRIYLQTYGEWTPIGTSTNIGQLSIEDLKGTTGPITFKDYSELLKAANLTNYIKSLYRGKSTGNLYSPFEKGSAASLGDRGDIMHNGSATEKKSIADYFNSLDKETISTGWFGTMKKVSPTLNENVESYVSYLNQLNIWNEKQKNVKRPNGVTQNYFELQGHKVEEKKENKTSGETVQFDEAKQIVSIGNKEYKVAIQVKNGNVWIDKRASSFDPSGNATEYAKLASKNINESLTYIVTVNGISSKVTLTRTK